MDPDIIAPRLLKWRAKYFQILKIANRWEGHAFLNGGCQQLIDELKVLATSGTVQPEAIEVMRGYLKALLNTQERWLLREAAVIEAMGAVKQ